MCVPSSSPVALFDTNQSISCRPQDRFLLGAYDEVGSGRSWSQGYEPSCRETESIAKLGCVTATSYVYWGCADMPSPTALTATGFIWVRYAFVITPVNYSLAGVRPFSLVYASITLFLAGKLFCRIEWANASRAYCKVRYIFRTASCFFLLKLSTQLQIWLFNTLDVPYLYTFFNQPRNFVYACVLRIQMLQPSEVNAKPTTFLCLPCPRPTTPGPL